LQVTRAQAAGIVSVDSTRWGSLNVGGKVRVSKGGGQVPIVARERSSVSGDWLHNVHKYISPAGGQPSS
jgi:hypothetical protein